MSASPAPRRQRFALGQSGGLLLVIALLATLLAVFGGSVRVKQRDPVTRRVIGEVEVNKFLQPRNIDSILKNASWIAIMAVGATVLIIAGGIDLSIGAIYCLAAVGGGMVLRWAADPGTSAGGPLWWGTLAGVASAVGIGAGCGLVNGSLVVLLRVHPFIITLGMMLIVRGIAFVISKAQAVTGYPPGFGDFVRYTMFDITIVPLIVMVVVVAAGAVLLRFTVAGRYLYAVGGNETAARFAGVRVARIKVLAFTLAGLTGGIAATLALGVFGSADSSTGRGYELDVIAAAVVGGASLSGGRGSALGALLGAVIIQLINNGIVILGIESNYSEIIKGMVIVLAVVLDRASAAMARRNSE